VLPAGDDWLVYPARSGLIWSVRLRIMQEGIEDFVLLEMLKRKNPQLADKILRSVVLDFDEYETNVKKFRSTRKLLLQSL
jgi:hypothetical protein